jgi:hypothetical protein
LNHHSDWLCLVCGGGVALLGTRVPAKLWATTTFFGGGYVRKANG